MLYSVYCIKKVFFYKKMILKKYYKNRVIEKITDPSGGQAIGGPCQAYSRGAGKGPLPGPKRMTLDVFLPKGSRYFSQPGKNTKDLDELQWILPDSLDLSPFSSCSAIFFRNKHLSFLFLSFCFPFLCLFLLLPLYVFDFLFFLFIAFPPSNFLPLSSPLTTCLPFQLFHFFFF